MPVITLVNEGKTLEAPEGTNLRQLLLKNKINLYRGKDKFLNCFGHGLCGTCRVEVVDGKGAPPTSALEESSLIGLAPFYARAILKNTRLACRMNITKDMSIKTMPPIAIDWKATKERLAMSLIWAFFGGTLLFVTVRLLLEIATGR